MTKSEIIRQLKTEHNSSFLPLNKAAKALGVGKDRMRKILEDTDYLEVGNSRRYLISDVADALLKMQRR